MKNFFFFFSVEEDVGMKSQHAAAHPSPCSAALNFLLPFPELQLLISVWETLLSTLTMGTWRYRLPSLMQHLP